jgi:phage shock protein A
MAQMMRIQTPMILLESAKDPRITPHRDPDAEPKLTKRKPKAAAPADDDEAALTELTTLYRKQEDHIKRLEAIVERYERMHKNADGISESAAPIRTDPLREAGRERQVYDNGASISFDDEPQKTWLRKAI